MSDYLIIIFMLVQAWVNVRFAHLFREIQKDSMENYERIQGLQKSHSDNYDRIIRVMGMVADTERRFLKRSQEDGKTE